MTQKTETLFSHRVEKELKKRDIWYMKVWGNMYQKSGVPDILACINGKFVGIELKTNTGKTSEIQKKNLSEIRNCGGIGIWVKESDEKRLVEVIDAMNNGVLKENIFLVLWVEEHSVIDYVPPQVV